MGHEAVKLELLEWLTNLEDEETLEYIKVVKDSMDPKNDWWNDLSKAKKASIAQGLKDIEEGRTTPHDEVKKRYGL